MIIMRKKINNFFQFDSQNEKLTLLFAALFYLLLFVFRLLSGSFYLADSYEYLEVAQKMQNLVFFDESGFYTIFSKRPFVYPLFLALTTYLQPIFVLLIQSLSAFFSFIFLFRIIKDYGLVPSKSFILFFALTPSIVIYTQLFMSEWLAFLLLNTLFFLLTRKEFSKKNFIFVQIITVLLAFTKPVFYPLIYLNVLFFGIYFFKIKRFSFWLFVPLLTLQLYLNYNKKISGYQYFSSIENINLINYNLYYFKSATQSPEVADAWREATYDSAYFEMSHKAQNKYLKDIAFQELRSAPIQYGIYHVLGGIRGMFDPGRFDLMTFFEEEDGKQGFLEILNGNKPLSSLFKHGYAYVYLLLIPIAIANVFKVFFALKFVVTNKLDARRYYMVSLLFFYVLLSGPVNNARLMVPLQGILIVFAVLGTKSKSIS